MKIQANDNSFECNAHEELGKGKEGIVYKVTIASKPQLGELALKKITEVDSVQALEHTEKLLTKKRKKSFSEIPSLECLLITSFISTDDKCCLLMPLAIGRDLNDDGDFWKLAKSLPLTQRYDLAYQIASGISRIHRHDLIHADIAGSNIMLSTDQSRAFIIDIDGGGIVNCMVPRVKGHAGWIAPEVEATNAGSTQESDCWSLAFLLHFLIVGMNPFWFCNSITDFQKFENNWPPTDETRVDHRILKFQLEVLDKNKNVANLFARCFGPGQRKPKERPSALEWEQCLRKQLHSRPHVKKLCPNCKEENEWQFVYCKQCGLVLHQAIAQCPSCQQYIPLNALYCPKCGSAQ